MKKCFISLLCLVSISHVIGQTFDPKIIQNNVLEKMLKSINENNKIGADSAWTILSSYNQYPAIQETGKEYLFFYKDSLFGSIPVRVFIPKSYSNKLHYPLVLVLHGAVSQSRFTNIDSSTMRYKMKGVDYTNSDGFYDYLCKQDFIVVEPLADVTKRFDWGFNAFKEMPNPTFNTLVNILVSLKRFLNIDDNKVFAYGHSDGSDGAFALDIFRPSTFAGFVGYNSMLNHIGGQVYLRNMVNKPFYLVHSDLDDLRPIQNTRVQIKILDSIKAPVLYKEYIGYSHEDKHLQIDRPYSLVFLKSISRNAFPKKIYWETDNSSFNTCDWLRITELDTTQQNAGWQKELNFNIYNKRTKEFENLPYYLNPRKSGAASAYYDNNHFNIQTSRVGELELLISPVMVNLRNPVIVEINGKTVFNKKLEADKDFLLKDFEENSDRQALWVNSIKLKVE